MSADPWIHNEVDAFGVKGGVSKMSIDRINSVSPRSLCFRLTSSFANLPQNDFVESVDSILGTVVIHERLGRSNAVVVGSVNQTERW